MNGYLQEIITTGSITGQDGRAESLHAHTNEKQGLLLQKIIREVKPKTSIEIGLGQGISALYICDAMQETGGQKHIVMDPFQDDRVWKNTGLYNIEKAGFKNMVEFYKNYSQDVLPKLHDGKVKIDFAYIDSTKVFDMLLVDTHYILKMLNIGGVICFDDCSEPSVRKLIRMLSKFPHLKVTKILKKDAIPARRKLIRSIIQRLIKMIPFKAKLFKSLSFEFDGEMNLDYHFIAFTKTAEDTRNWDWYGSF